MGKRRGSQPPLERLEFMDMFVLELVARKAVYGHIVLVDEHCQRRRYSCCNLFDATDAKLTNSLEAPQVWCMWGSQDRHCLPSRGTQRSDGCSSVLYGFMLQEETSIMASRWARGGDRRSAS